MAKVAAVVSIVVVASDVVDQSASQTLRQTDRQTIVVFQSVDGVDG